MEVFETQLMLMKNKDPLSKGIQTSSIALPVIILAPILITMGFKGVKLESPLIGWILLIVGITTAILGMYLLAKGIKYLLDYLFEK